jgi:C4-type Zn-finger protein
MHPAFLVAAAALVVLLALASVAVARGTGGRNRPAATRAPRRRRVRCPICGSGLDEGESVRTVAYPGRGERLVHLYGCSRCYGAAASVPRRCPVCRALLEGEDYLVGRLLPGEPRGRVRVWGCSRCRLPQAGR